MSGIGIVFISHVYRCVLSCGCCFYVGDVSSLLCIFKGEKLTDDEVDALLTGIEDSQGQVNYEGAPPPPQYRVTYSSSLHFSRVCQDGDVWMSCFVVALASLKILKCSSIAQDS